MIREVFKVFTRPLLPMTTQQERMWIWKAIDQPACYSSMMFVTRSMQMTLAGRIGEQNIEATYYQSIAIRQINEKLAEGIVTRNSGLILAIVCLAVYEVGYCPLTCRCSKY
jgi:hypothetical protein